MQNEVTRNIPGLLTSAEDAADAAATFGSVIGLKQNTDVEIRTDIAGLADGVDRYELAKSALAGRRTDLAALVDQSRTFATLCREILKPHLGNQYSEGWDVTGFAGSLRIPRRAEELQPLMQRLQRYFLANPAREVADLNLTAAQARALFDSLSGVRSTIHELQSQLSDLLNLRDVKAAKLRRRLRGLIDELDQLIDPLDVRWLAFGLNMPGASERPDTPVNVEAVPIENDAVVLTWDAAPRAERYRVWRRIVGTDLEFEAVGNANDPHFTAEDLPRNSTIEFAMSAVNNGGESPLTDVVRISTA